MYRVESIVDPRQAQYNSDVFEVYYLKMYSDVRSKILELASAFSAYGKINAVYMVGSLLTLHYTDTSDIDINLILTPYSDDALANARNAAFECSDVVMLKDTQHPINFFVEAEFTAAKHDAIYDVLRDTWVKQPDERSIDVDKYWSTFQDLAKDITADRAELMSDLADFDRLEAMRPEHHKDLQARLEKVIAEIDADVKKLVGTLGTVHGLRKAAFSQDMSLDDIREYESKNALPANVVYKLLQRYSYLQFLQRVKAALKAAGGDIDTEQDVQTVKATTESQIEKAIDIVIKEMTGSGGCGPYEMPLGAVPYWKRRKKKKIPVKTL